MRIPFTKAHGAHNDFLLTWEADVPVGDRVAMAKAICERHTGVGADGWLIVTPGSPAAIRLLNSDGSDSEMSGNGTRCAAAFLIENGQAQDEVDIMTGAGLKHLHCIGNENGEFVFEMNMGPAHDIQPRTAIDLASGPREAVTLNVGNPQCAIIVDDFDFDWRKLGAEIEWHSRFPQRTNVSFLKCIDAHTIDVRFWERGAGETMSSGTGSTGAAFAAILRGLAESPVKVSTPAGPLHLRLEGTDMMLIGPAEVVATGEFYWRKDK